MKMHDKVKVSVGKYTGKTGEVVGIHGREYSVIVYGVPYVQVYAVGELQLSL